MRIDLKHTELFLRPDGIVQMNASNHTYNISDLKELNLAQGKITDGKRKPLVIIASPYSNIESDARQFMATEESSQYSLAEAFVINSLAHKIIANFYLKVDKPKVPTRFFSDMKSAEEWLKSLV